MGRRFGALTLLVAGCVFDPAGLPTPPLPGDGPADAALDRVLLRDAAKDTTGHDARPADLQPHDMGPVPEVLRPPLDKGPVGDKGPVADLPLVPDLPPTPDLPPAPDLPLPDQPLVLSKACSSGTEAFTFQPTMIVCQHPSTLTQCDAAAACNAPGGWHVCTATEYLARGGATIPHPFGSGWIASCIRSGGAPHAPTDGICPGSCANAMASSTSVAWTCSTGSAFNRSEAYIGVSIRDACRRVGVDQASTEAYWTYGSTGVYSFYYVVCCH